MYLLGLSVVYAAIYLILLFSIPLFLGNTLPKVGGKSAKSTASIFIFYFIILVVSFSISDPDLSNRILHTLGGGALVVLICFLAIKDSNSKINKFQFFVISVSAATLFGVVNEILEFYLQNYFGFIFADSVNDTWLDLISNTTGATLAAACLLPFIKKSS